MASWYTAATPQGVDRLLAAWPGAPIENQELCEMLLEVARLQVKEYAPNIAATPDASPLRFDFTVTGGTVGALDIVLAPGAVAPGYTGDFIVPVAPDAFGTVLNVEFTVTGGVASFVDIVLDSDVLPADYSGLYTIPAPNMSGIRFEFSVLHGVVETVDVVLNSSVLPDGFTGTWSVPVAPEALTMGVPVNYVYAQLQQARNLWAAGTADENGGTGPDDFRFTPRPLDKTIRQLIRPAGGAAVVF